MCLYPQLIKNRKYTETQKNRGIIPPVTDERTLYTPIGCQLCIECRKKKAREWQVRLQEDIKTNKNGKFITLTLSNENYEKINKEIPELKIIERKNWKGEIIIKEKKIIGYARDNAIATKAIHLFRERWRKEHKTSVRHWLITELGHNGTENIHIHGILWTDKQYEEIEKHWQYGYIWPRKTLNKKGQWTRQHTWVNARTINYMTKYVYKIDEIHQNFQSIILTSAGIGGNYKSDKNNYIPNNTKETYRTTTGHQISLPIYYRNKIYTEEEKEKLWIEKLNKEERWILGNKINIKNGEKEYYKSLKEAQKINTELGYNNPKKAWKIEQYEKERRIMNQEKRLRCERKI